jgi:hypothetical protein
MSETFPKKKLKNFLKFRETYPFVSFFPKSNMPKALHKKKEMLERNQKKIFFKKVSKRTLQNLPFH